ncbi:MAG: FeS-binding protein [Proteobacteria bacterium]|nr:FeS-binding protein [Pseudomonadota bacterium]
MSGGHVKRKVYLTFPQDLIKEPVVYNVGRKFEVVTNIRTASVTEEMGIMALEMTGEEEEYQKAVEYLRGLGVRVDPIEMDVIE